MEIKEKTWLPNAVVWSGHSFLIFYKTQFRRLSKISFLFHSYQSNNATVDRNDICNRTQIHLA